MKDFYAQQRAKCAGIEPPKLVIVLQSRSKLFVLLETTADGAKHELGEEAWKCTRQGHNNPHLAHLNASALGVRRKRPMFTSLYTL